MEITSLAPWPGIEGAVALVTGGSRGIGSAITEALARQGAIVVATATSEAGAEDITQRLEAAKLRGRGLVLDVTRQESVDALFAELGAEEGLPTILVNNAGITRDNLLLRMKEEEWDDVIATDLTSVFRICKAGLRHMMKARHGRIINITSVVGLMGNAGQANYAAAKAGVVGFTKSLAREVASRQITVNAIAPGFIVTDMTRALSEEQTQTLSRQIPCGRLGSPADVAAAAVFLASEAGAYITGETLNVNGGLHLA
jgi:3-oxoacyl-[acyl-carrier protein] reductase